MLADHIWHGFLSRVPDRRLRDEVIRRNRLGSMRRHPSSGGHLYPVPEPRGQQRPPRVVVKP